MSSVPKTKENLMKCQCMNCPTYSDKCKEQSKPELEELQNGNMDRTHAEAMFCAYEKSNCINEEKQCICPTCPLFSEYNLTNNYFCIQTGGK
jgi:hypothetical protein